MGAIIKFLLELIKYGPAIIQIIQAIIEMLAKQGRKETVVAVKSKRDEFREKRKVGSIS
jgi:hypothetical protein